MSNSADYTIQGFLYQFNKTVLEILSSDNNDTITVEGVNEDIKVLGDATLTAIQCKYHETIKNFTPSAIYKPLLQMLKNYSENQSETIKYKLFAHFPEMDTSVFSVNEDIIRSALASENKTLKKTINKIPDNIDIDGFLKQFSFEKGVSYDQIVTDVVNELKKHNFSSDQIEILFYPNAIHKIAMLSINHNEKDRQITKKNLFLGFRRYKKQLFLNGHFR